MAPQVQLTRSQVADLAVIRDLPLELLHEITQKLKSTTPVPMRPEDVVSEISSILGESDSILASRIVRPLLAFQAIIRQRRLAINEVIFAVRMALESASPSWNKSELELWDKVQPVFSELLTLPVIRLISITLDLMYEYENLLQSVRVVTDIRPVFTEDAIGIDGSVISHTLRIRYDSTEGNHSISIAMDETDVHELERQCKRAILKAKTAQAIMNDKAKVPTVISGGNPK